MVAEIPAVPPTEIRAGDTLQWRRELSDYPASAGWVLAYTFVNAGAAKALAATADGDAFAVTLTAAVSAGYPAGRYTGTEYVTNAGTSQRFTIGTFPVLVIPDLAAATVGVDTRTHARKALAAIELWLETRAPSVALIWLEGRKLENHTIPDLLMLRDRYRAEVLREERLAAGLPAARLLVRF